MPPLGPFERIGAWLGIWTPPVGAEVPPVPRGRLALAGAGAVLLLAAVAVLVALPAAEEARERDAADRRERAEAVARRVAAERAAARPRRGSSEASTPAAVLADLQAHVARDARARVGRGELSGPILEVHCEPFPRSVRRPAPIRGIARYECIAARSRIPAGDWGPGGRLGHPYRARVDLDSGRYAFCKISGRPGEGALGRSVRPGVPEECGGRT